MNALTFTNNAQEYEMEAFSNLIQQLHLEVEVYHNAQVCGDWRIEEHNAGQTCFHMVTKGQCCLDVPGHLKTELDQGDLVIFPRELSHSMWPLNKSIGEQQHLPYSASVNGESTGMLCAQVEFRHRGSRFLLDALPEVFVVKAKENLGWINSLLEMIMAESLNRSAGTETILDRLSELLFIYALRHYLSEYPEKVGVLALYGHPRLATALAALHRDPAAAWTLESLAKHAAMSRTSFAQTFKQTCGWTVMQYLTWWRMQLAWSKLSNGENVSQVSNDVGYQSEAAFSRAFQKRFALSPGKVRFSQGS